MPKLPWLRLVLGLGVGILSLGLIAQILQIYQAIAQVQPTIANLLLGAFLLGLGLLIWQYVRLFTKRSPRFVTPQITDKYTAATANLEALQKQVEQIEDEIIRRSLQAQSSALQTNLDQADINVVIFGTGSAGKTSLVNSLLGQELGAVGGVMGTTTGATIYENVQISGRLNNHPIDVKLTITDTPGILEAGLAGSDREQLAKTVAGLADLIIFVVDNDLLQSEYALLQNLSSLGKRLILAFNKIDLYTKADQQIILDSLKNRVAAMILPSDVVAIAAQPQPLTLESGEIITPKPILKPLLKRLIRILDNEGDDLVADNILWRSQQLGNQTRELLDQQRQTAAEQVIEKFQWLVVGVIFATPVPLLDLLATAAINAQMVVEIAKIYNCDLDLNRGKELAASLAKTITSLGIIKGVSQIVTSLISVTVVGYLVRSTVQSITGAYLTRIAGKSFMEYFQANQTWGDGGISAVVERQFQLNRRDEFVQSFIKQAIQKLNP